MSAQTPVPWGGKGGVAVSSLLHSIVRGGGSDAADSDARLVAAAMGGDRGALDSLYRRHCREAFTLALRLTGDRELANDAVQDAFLRAFDRLASYRSDAPFGFWLKRIVANIAIDRMRSERRHRFDDSFDDLLPAPDDDPSARYDALGLLARLPGAARTVLVLFEFEGLSHREIARLLGRTETWSKTVLCRARGQLARLLQTENGR